MSAKPTTIATIATGHGHQIRVRVSRWREHTKLELKPYSATIPDCFMPCGVGVSVDLSKADELVAAITAAKKKALGHE
jgi:hypothetical protein